MACGRSFGYTSRITKIKTQEKDLDINQIFDELINTQNLSPRCYPLEFELDSIRDVFEFLLQLSTLLFKHFHGDENGKVSLETLNQEDLQNINNHIMALGYKCNFQCLPANSYNLDHTMQNRYDKIPITSHTILKELMMGIKCSQKLFIINFDILPL